MTSALSTLRSVLKAFAREVLLHKELCRHTTDDEVETAFRIINRGTKGAGKSDGTGSADNDQPKRRDIVCYDCGKKGHMKRDCRHVSMVTI